MSHTILELNRDLIKPYIDNQDDVIKQTLNNFEESITGEVVDSEPYVLRQGLGNLADMELVGGSLAWNQLVQNGNFASASGWTADANTSISASNNELTATITGSNKAVFYRTMASNSTHKYLISADVKSANSITESLMAIGNATESKKFFIPSTSYQNIASVVFGESSSNLVYFYLYGAVGNTFNIKNVNVFDLTQLFGSSTIADYIYSLEQATAGAGVAFFRKYFPNAYYGYQSGKIESVNVASRKVVGKNLFDEDYLLGYYDGNGNYIAGTSDTTRLCSNKLLVPNVSKLTISMPNGFYAYRFCCWDNSENLIEVTSDTEAQSAKVLNVPANTYYFAFSCRNNAGTNILPSDIAWCQLEIGTTATSYEPYKEYTFPFANKQLRGIPKLVNNKLSYDGDIWKANEGITRRYGIVNMGDMDWIYASGDTRFISQSIETIIKPAASTTAEQYKSGLLCSKYEANESPITTHDKDKTIAKYTNGRIFVVDLSYNDADTFKAAMDGVYLVYELATPTTETAEPFQNPQRAFIDGTEEFVDYGVQSATRDVSIPVGNNTTYQLNETLPPIEDYVDGATALIVNDIKVLEKDIDAVKFSLMNRSPISTRVNPKLKTWVPKVWGGNTSFQGYDIWTDGDNIYYSGGSSPNMQCVLDKKTSTWIPKVWNGEEQAPYGYYIWSDGDNIYHNSSVYNKANSSFTPKTWSGLTVDNGGVIWTDGDNIYYSMNTNHYVLDKATSTWVPKTWNGLTNFYGYSVWTDGDNIYYSMNTNHYVLDKATSTWASKTWNGLTNFNGGNIWSDGVNIYYSNNNNQYVLDKMSSTWVPKTWTGCTNIGASNIWSDGDNIYYSNDEDQYVLKTVTLGSTR